MLIVSGSDEITIDEIGEINDYIQAEAGNNTNIIMGVGEDKLLGNEISVTIIATGFDVDQQNEISNTEAKKIIHTLEDDQLIQQEFSNKLTNENNENSFDVGNNNSVGDSLDLVVTNEIIGEIDVVYEDLSKNLDFEVDEFKSQTDSIDIDLNNISKDKENIEVQKTQKEKENFIIKDLSDDIKDIEVYDYEVVSGDEFQTKFDFEIPFKKKNLEQRIQANEIIESKDNIESNNFSEDLKLENIEEINFEVKGFDDDLVKEDININNSEEEGEGEEEFKDEINEEKDCNNNPFEISIDETFSSNPDKRREQLKEFNYKFKHKITRVDDMENEPAYKRMGLDINENIPKGSSRLSLDSDSNDDLQLRSNNSFLHDNVD